MWDLDHRECWWPKNWYFWSVVLEKSLESPLDCKKTQVHPKGYQSWVFIGGIDVEAETPILQPPDKKSWLIWKDPDTGQDWRQEEKGMTEDEMVGWHHWLDGHGFRWTPGVGDGQGGLACCGSWVRKESDRTERLNGTEHPSYTLLCVLITSLSTAELFSWSHSSCSSVDLQNEEAELALSCLKLGDVPV